MDEHAAVVTLRAAGCVFAEAEAALLVAQADDADELARLVAERAGGRALEHVLGWSEFYGQRLRVTDGVFVPRIRSELLAREAIARASNGMVVVEPCCGCGAIGAALLAARPDVELHVSDLDPIAVDCARVNLPGAATVATGDLLEPLPRRLRGTVGMVVANVPYVPTGELDLLPREARLHEAVAALDGGADGIDVQRRLAHASIDWLRPGGLLLVETGAHQADLTVAAFAAAGLDAIVVHDDELEATVVVGTYPGRAGVS